MKISVRHSIQLPIAQVFEALSDTEELSRQAVARGAMLRRMSSSATKGVGSAWRLWVDVAGKSRAVDLKVTEIGEPRVLRLSLLSRNFAGSIDIELNALSHATTQLVVGIEIRPRSLPGRLMIQSARLIKPTLERRLRNRIARRVRALETRCHGEWDSGAHRN